MSMFGWMTESQAIHYTKGVNRTKLAASAVTLVRVETSTKLERNGIQSVPLTTPIVGRWDKTAKMSKEIKADFQGWRSHGESNPGFSLERAAS